MLELLDDGGRSPRSVDPTRSAVTTLSSGSRPDSRVLSDKRFSSHLWKAWVMGEWCGKPQSAKILLRTKEHTAGDWYGLKSLQHPKTSSISKGALVIVGCTFLAFLLDLKSLPHTDFVVEALYVSWYLMQDSIRSEMTKQMKAIKFFSFLFPFNILV